MPLIQCKLGPAQPVVGDNTYDFRVDKHGRYVAEVHNITHMTVLLSVEHYIIAPEIQEAQAEPAADATPPQPTRTPVVRRDKRRGN
jgi:hypothetical protein